MPKTYILTNEVEPDLLQGRHAINRSFAAAEVTLNSGHKGTNQMSTIACRRSLCAVERTATMPSKFLTLFGGPKAYVRAQQEQVDASLAPERSFASVTAGFGVLALLLASIGIYGVMAAAVSRRINEIGVRMALGARADQVLRMVLSEASVLALAGVCVGLLAASLPTRFLASFLYGLKPTDTLTFVVSGILLWIVALAASWSPARRASQIQPVRALRHE